MRIVITLMAMVWLLPVLAQTNKVTLSGVVKEPKAHEAVSFANVVLKTETDSHAVAGTITGEDGRFVLPDISSGNYLLMVSLIGYTTSTQRVLIGTLSTNQDMGVIVLQEGHELKEVVVNAKQDEVSGKMDKKTFTVADNISQGGGSVLESMKNLPGVTVQDGKVQLRGSDKVMVLIDGKQTALTGFGNQSGLDNIPASAIEKIEIINNPSAKYDANGNAGIINIIYKKEKQDGFNGKVGMAAGVGALWVKKENYPGINPQYQYTPKLNPSLSLNYRNGKVNLFFQGDYLLKRTLNKNEFVERTYDDGTVVKQQTKRNRTTNTETAKLGFDWYMSNRNMLTVSGLFSSERIIDRGDEPFFNGTLTERQRLWQFVEDELKTTATFSSAFQHKFEQPGRLLNVGLNYTFHRENERYDFNNIMPAFTGYDAFRVLSDEHVADLNIDYIQPLRYGRFETGVKLRRRYIPVNMHFMPGLNSPLDTNAGGWANYSEVIPAVYGNYVFESKHLEVEVGLRVEYVKLNYEVNPDHNTYKSNGYNYTKPFPNLRFTYKLNDRNRISLFCNRRVDRPDEVDIRIFPKYDNVEIIKVGNPALKPQFTSMFELGYKTGWSKGYVYTAAYHKITDGTITRIGTVVPGSTLIYNVYQNAGRSYNTGLELLFSQEVTKWFVFNVNLNGYQNTINAFTVENRYPVPSIYSADRQQVYSGNAKINTLIHLPKQVDVQVTGIYLAPDIIPQGKMGSRFSLDMGLKKTIQKGKGEVFINANDIANTMKIRKEVRGNGFHYTLADYEETQVVRAGYSYKF